MIVGAAGTAVIVPETGPFLRVRGRAAARQMAAASADVVSTPAKAGAGASSMSFAHDFARVRTLRSIAVPCEEYNYKRVENSAKHAMRLKQRLNAKQAELASECAQFKAHEEAFIVDFMRKCASGDETAVEAALRDFDWLGEVPQRHALENGVAEACHVGALKTVIRLLDLQAAVGAVSAHDAVRQTPLHSAISGDQTEVVRELLDRGATVNALNDFGVSPLHAAIMKGSAPLVELLLAHKADVNLRAETAESYAPLHHAVCCVAPSAGEPKPGDLAILQMLLDAGAAVNGHAGFQYTPLHLVCNHAHLEAATLLLEHRADPDLGSHNGSTPLHVAVMNAVLHSGERALPNAPNTAAAAATAATAGERGERTGCRGRGKSSGDDGGSSSSSVQVARSKLWRYDQLVQLLLAHHAAGVVMDHGITPLIMACEAGATDVVKRLLEAGHAPNEGRFLDMRPLQWAQSSAATAGRGGCVALLTRALKQSRGRGGGRGAWTPRAGKLVDDEAARAAAIARAEAGGSGAPIRRGGDDVVGVLGREHRPKAEEEGKGRGSKDGRRRLGGGRRWGGGCDAAAGRRGDGGGRCGSLTRHGPRSGIGSPIQQRQ